MDDLFEKIVRREIPAEIVYEDEHTLAFLDIKPVNHGHTLVIPKKRYRNLLETPNDELAPLMTTVKNVAKAVMQGMKADGINVIFNNESSAGQIIFHTHAHIIPRFANDGFRGWPQGTYSEHEIKAVGEKIRTIFES